MTHSQDSEGNAPSPPQVRDDDWRLARSGVRGTWFGALGTWIVGAVGVAVAIHFGIQASAPSSTGPDTQTGVSPSSATSQSPNSVPSPTHASPPLAVGSCLTKEQQVVGCDEPHVVEIVSMERCTPDIELRHLGGEPALDALSPTVRTSHVPVGSRTACGVTQDGASFVGSLHNVLSTDAGVRFRWCRTTVMGNSDVPCSEPHDEEVMGRARSGKDCEGMLARFLGRHDLPMELDTSATTIDGTLRCVVRATASQRLDDTLRGRGNTALPIA